MPWLKIPDRGKRQQEYCPRRRCQRDQRNIDDAVDLLAGPAMIATGKMQFVIPAHLRSQTRDIVAPSRKDFPYDRFDTVTHKRLNDIRAYNRMDSRTSVWAASSTWLCHSPGRPPSAFSATARAISGWLFCSDKCAKTKYSAS